MKNTQKIQEVLDSGNWMLRRSNSGKSYGGFQWEPIGEWTEAPDWNPKKECGGGLHGNGPKSSGDWTDGKDIDFCEINPSDMVDLDGKIKVRRSRILLRNQLPEGLKVGGDLDLEGTEIKELPKGLKVGGSLDLEGTEIKELPEGLEVGGEVYKDF